MPYIRNTLPMPMLAINIPETPDTAKVSTQINKTSLERSSIIYAAYIIETGPSDRLNPSRWANTTPRSSVCLL